MKGRREAPLCYNFGLDFVQPMEEFGDTILITESGSWCVLDNNDVIEKMWIDN